MNTDMHINTLHIYERLKKVKSFDAQARELADIFGSFVDDQLADKSGIVTLKTDLKTTEAMLKNDLKQTEARLQNDLKQTELKLQGEIQKSKSETIRWIIGWVTGLLITQTGFLFAYLK